ncbi:MAG: DUF3035 domain-containing protein [Pseudomonadota bacterium]
MHSIVRSVGKAGLVIGLAMGVTACGSTSIFDRDRPDEFAVSRQAPLVIPPDFALQPPRPGVARPQQSSASEQALEALFGGPQARSATERATIERAGAADPAIRSTVADPDTDTVDKGTVVRDIIAAPEGDGREAQSSIPQ